MQGQELLAQAVAGKDTQPANAPLGSGVFKKSAAHAASESGTTASAVAAANQGPAGGATAKSQVKSVGKVDGGKVSGASQNVGSKASKSQGKAQDKGGGMRQATLGQFFRR